MMLDKKANLSVSCLSSKWVAKQQRQLTTSKRILLMNIQCSDISRSFAKETRVLKMRNAVAGHQKLTKTS